MRHDILNLMISLFLLFEGVQVETIKYENCDGYINSSTNTYVKTKAIDTENEDTVDESRRDFKYEYFRGLTENFGDNIASSCGYVAMGQLLSYYDTYLNDGIIDEKYDIASIGYTSDMISRKNSPGVLNDTPQGMKKFSDSKSYLSYLKSVRDKSFQANLICIGDELGYFHTKNKFENCCLTTFSQRIDILDYYLSAGESTFDFVYLYANGDNTKSDDVRSFTIKQLKLGNPVLLNIGNYSGKGGHVSIAYDYDEAKDKIYCHMGWHDQYDTHLTPEEVSMPYYYGALTIDFTFTNHICSNNYIIKGQDEKTYCYNNPNIKTYFNHKHNFYVTRGPRLDITKTCDCGACYKFITPPHYNF